ncbi:MAG: hypothetical protein D5R97_03305 [Candidatus Syntrophonatronum acetioxidans]|uniref:UDP-N-acetylmuramyl pentapeptide phosphotransferase n=1 Tax=Candidatus Syntrophonatronum acetioxidans TaxID=1795816 RepID=A0A424YGD9_9FIRM|nr:MAG: hypothetical protein D5R97_03305 [Candidatus Syntrophonatronum acetioxidans]
MVIIMVLISSILSFFLVISLLPLLKKGFLRQNYRGKTIPSGLGIIMVLSHLLLTLPLIIAAGGEDAWLIIYKLFLILGISQAGIIDDFLGDRNRGFYGHFLCLMKKGELTSGLIKVTAGGILGLLTAYLVGGPPYLLILNALLFPLTVNTFNLLDVRPGRSLKAFIFLSFLLFLWVDEGLFLVLTPVLGAAIILFPLDLQEEGMLGDVGSNLLGASLGFILVLVLDYRVKALLVPVLVILQWRGDKVSLTRLIEKNYLLNYFDNLGRKQT